MHAPRLVKRSRAWKEFARGRFDDALDLLPDPSDADADSRRREWLMLARIQARRGDAWKASVALAEAKKEPSTDPVAPLEIAAIEILVEIAEGHLDLALDQLRDCVRVLERWRLEYGDQSLQKAQDAIIDLATGQKLLAAELRQWST